MTRDIVDKIIIKYMKKLYGFALSKTKNIDKAEELASQITFEVYKSLLNIDQLHNINSYIYKIACNVYAHFIKEEYEEKLMYDVTDIKVVSEDIEQVEAHSRIRREISFLSNLHREIVIMYYYEKLKIKDIAEKLNTYPGKIMWHLHEARNQLKDSFLEKKGINLSPKNINFTEMRNYGRVSPLNIGMPFYFKKSISKDIAYLSYYEPQTSLSLANILNIPVAFIEDEIFHLVDNGYLLPLPGDKFISNIYITELNYEIELKINNLLQKNAKYICDMYMPLLFDTIKNYLRLNKNKIYTPLNDFNFLMWSISCFACFRKLPTKNVKNDISKLSVERKDGGVNIAMASVLTKSNLKNKKFFRHGDLSKHSSVNGTDKVDIWLFTSYFDNRKEEEIFDFYMNLEKLYYKTNGRIIKNISQIDNFVNLYEKGVIVSNKKSEYFNLIITTLSDNELVDILPSMPKELKSLSVKLDKELYLIAKNILPKHMHKISKIININSFTKRVLRYYILEHLLKSGMLKPLKKNQTNTVNMIVFSDFLPEGC